MLFKQSLADLVLELNTKSLQEIKKSKFVP